MCAAEPEPKNPRRRDQRFVGALRPREYRLAATRDRFDTYSTGDLLWIDVFVSARYLDSVVASDL